MFIRLLLKYFVSPIKLMDCFLNSFNLGNSAIFMKIVSVSIFYDKNFECKYLILKILELKLYLLWFDFLLLVYHAFPPIIWFKKLYRT